MERNHKENWQFLVFLFILIVPVLALLWYSWLSRVIENEFWYAYMAYFGTVVLAYVAFWQNNNAHKVNQKLLENEIIRSRAYVSVYTYKNFENYDQYESFLSDNTLAFLTNSATQEIQCSTRHIVYMDGGIRCIEFNLLGDSPVIEVKIETVIKYYRDYSLLNSISEKNPDRYKGILKQLKDMDEEFDRKLELVCVPVFPVTKKYLQLIPSEQYYVGSIDSIIIHYRTLGDEKIKYEYKLLNYSDIVADVNAEEVVSERYFTIRNNKEEPLFDEITYKSGRFQTNKNRL